MSIKIHHGPDGTFKTSGAIKDDIMSVIKTGRVLVTNVRGFSYDNTVEVLGDDFVHTNFDVIHVDTDSEEGRKKLARFFHWAPKGAFFVIDEVQRIFPPKWTEKHLEQLNYLEPQDHLPEDERRPETIHVAWDMQRHHNWDFIFTTTNIKKVHEMARLMAKVAVRHVNTGLWRFYKTVEHDAESNGKTAASITTTKVFNFVPSKIFRLYASTTTGTFENTEPRTPFYKDTKVLGLLFMLACLWIYIFSKPAPKALGGGSVAVEEVVPVKTPTQGNEVVIQKNTLKASDIVPSNKNSQSIGGHDDLASLPKAYLSQFDEVFINGYSKTQDGISMVFTAFKGSIEYQFNSDVLLNVGIRALFLQDCVVEFTANGLKRYVFCKPEEVKAPVQQYDFQPPESLNTSFSS